MALNFQAGAQVITPEFRPGRVWTVVRTYFSDSYGSGLAVVLSHPSRRTTLTVDSQHVQPAILGKVAHQIIVDDPMKAELDEPKKVAPWVPDWRIL